jgi:hypothetical protein
VVLPNRHKTMMALRPSGPSNAKCKVNHLRLLAGRRQHVLGSTNHAQSQP